MKSRGKIHGEDPNTMNTTEDYIDQHQKNLPHLLNSGAAQPARLIPSRRVSHSKGSDEQSRTFDNSITINNQFQDKETGLWLKPVSASMIDIEDLIYNK